MPDKPTEKTFVPRQLYDLKVIIKDLDYTNDVTEVTLTSSLASAYQVIDIKLSLDPTDVIMEDIFGGEPIKLTITLTREETYPGPSIDVELLYLTSDFKITQKSTLSEGKQKERSPFKITTVVRKAFKTMAATVNDVFIGTNLSSIISSLASSVGATVEYDTDGQNTESIEQVCIPPMPFYKIIKECNRGDESIYDGFLDQRFGLFDGTPGVFCQYDNKVYIKNLTGKLNKDQAFTVYQLSSGGGDKLIQKIIEDSGSDGKTFYTYSTIETSYAGNSRFADLASTIKNVVKPKDSLVQTLEINLSDIAQKYSLLNSNKNKNLYVDNYTDRTRYNVDDTGHETSSTPFNSRYGKLVSDLSSISLYLERNLPVLNLINVGECVKLKPTTVEYQDFEGKYILWSSVITFSRQGPSWSSRCKINLNRTNKKK